MAERKCAICGKPESDSKHIKYGPDEDNPVKHWFEPKKRMMAAIGLDGVIHYRRPEGDPLLAEAERRGYVIWPVEERTE